MKLSIETDRSLIREGGRSVRYALLSFTAPEPSRVAERPPLNVAFVLDRSGSMGGSKIDLARTAVVQALRMLRETDRFAVVSYDNEVDVVVPSTSASSEAVTHAIAAVQRIQARGNTNLSAGWLRGCEQIAEYLRAEETTRCLLLSDGLANEGITDRDELARHAAALRERGITTSCLGIGADYDERLLDAIATAGRGHSYHVETAIQIPDFLRSELGEALETVARDVTVTVRGGAGVTATTLNRYSMAANADGSVSLHLGDLVARQDVALVFRLQFPRGRAGETSVVSFAVRDRQGVFTDPAREAAFTFATHSENDAQGRNRRVDFAVAELYTAVARAEALELNRARRFDAARERLEKTARKIESYAGSDPELRRLVAELRERDDPMYAATMSAIAMKRAYAENYNVSRMRDPLGRAKRSE